jgi:RND family efflux transporter MFP subunit
MKRLFVIVALSLACSKKAPPEVKPRPVLSVIAHSGLGGHRTFPGTVQPRYVTQLAFRTGGRVTKRLVSMGDTVKKGDVIATLDSGALASNAAAARANVEAVDARRRNAQQTHERTSQLLANQVATQSAMDDVSATRDTAAASVAEATAKLSKAREDLSYGTLRADFDGVITKIDFEVEQTVAPNQVIAEMARPDALDVVVDVSESVVGRLQIGDDATSSPADDLSISIPGHIRQISPSADRLTRTYRVWIAIPGPLKDIRLGATAYATFAEDFPAAVRVPNEAILDKDGKEYVWVVDNDAVHLRAVTCADRKGRRAVVTDGVRDGERVVIAGVHQLTDGQAIAKASGDEP